MTEENLGAQEEKKDEEVPPETAKKEEQPEPDFLVLSNPTRILKAQEKKIVYQKDQESRYYPVLNSRFSGFLVLRETRSLHEGETEEFYDDEERNLDAPNPDLASDLQIPAAFEFDPAVQNAQ